jgi:hypothetical protein
MQTIGMDKRPVMSVTVPRSQAAPAFKHHALNGTTGLFGLGPHCETDRYLRAAFQIDMGAEHRFSEVPFDECDNAFMTPHPPVVSDIPYYLHNKADFEWPSAQ